MLLVALISTIGIDHRHESSIAIERRSNQKKKGQRSLKSVAFSNRFGKHTEQCRQQRYNMTTSYALYKENTVCYDEAYILVKVQL
jgi:hypothetical protein